MSAEPRFIPRATTDERIKVRLHVARREPLRTHARSVPVCWRFLGPPARVPWFVVGGERVRRLLGGALSLPV